MTGDPVVTTSRASVGSSPNLVSARTLPFSISAVALSPPAALNRYSARGSAANVAFASVYVAFATRATLIASTTTSAVDALAQNA